MNPLETLPSWAVVIIAVVAAVVLIAMNISWLLAAKGMLDAQRRDPGPKPRARGPKPQGRDEDSGGSRA